MLIYHRKETIVEQSNSAVLPIFGDIITVKRRLNMWNKLSYIKLFVGGGLAFYAGVLLLVYLTEGSIEQKTFFKWLIVSILFSILQVARAVRRNRVKE